MTSQTKRQRLFIESSYRKRKKKSRINQKEPTKRDDEDLAAQLDDVFTWQSFFTFYAPDPLRTLKNDIIPLLPREVKADLHKHMESWMQSHFEQGKWPEHKMFIELLRTEDNHPTMTPERIRLKLIVQGARAGRASQLYNLAAAYEVGRYGLPADDHKALYYFTKAHDAEEPWATYALGYIFLHGSDAAKADEKRGLDYLGQFSKDLAPNMYAYSQITLAQYYYEKRELQAADQFSMALTHFENAVQAGFVLGYYHLGRLLLPSNRDRALTLLQAFTYNFELVKTQSECTPCIKKDPPYYEPFLERAKVILSSSS